MPSEIVGRPAPSAPSYDFPGALKSGEPGQQLYRSRKKSLFCGDIANKALSGCGVTADKTLSGCRVIANETRSTISPSVLLYGNIPEQTMSAMYLRDHAITRFTG